MRDVSLGWIFQTYLREMYYENMEYEVSQLNVSIFELEIIQDDPDHLKYYLLQSVLCTLFYFIS